MDERGGGEAARAAAESAAKEEATSRKPPRIDVSKLADFRYSKIKVGGRETPYINIYRVKLLLLL